MKDSDKCPTDNETILMALDQIGQTIDVMNSVVGRLRTHLLLQVVADILGEDTNQLHGACKSEAAERSHGLNA